jgi:ornithine decarboxylase
MTLLTSVVGSATRAGRSWHYLDDGLYGSYSNVMTEDVHPPIIALAELDDVRGGQLPLDAVTLAGPTCDSVDVVASDYPMPALRVGDVVVSPMMGAYTTVTSSRFNGIGETPIVVANAAANHVDRVGP